MKKFLSFLLSLLLVFTININVFAEEPVKIMIDGELVEFNEGMGYPFIDENGRTQVPFRIVLEKIGAKVTWDQESYAGVGEKDGVVIKVPIGKDYILANDKKIENDTISLIKEGRTYLPIRVVMEAFGYKVGWEGQTRTVVITSQPELAVHYIDVGQAESIFIDYGDYDILIDGGNNSDGQLVVDYLNNLGTDDIEIMVATHVHEDHVGGLDEVLKAFEVETIIDSGESHTTKTYEDYINAVIKEKEQGANVLEDDDMSFNLGNDVVFKVIELGDGYEETNNNSVVTMLDYNDIEFLFTGDLESDVENSNLDKFEDIDILKVAHHGSKTSSSFEFLSKVKPEVAVISAGLNNDFGHPHLETLVRLGNFTQNIYGTWNSGSIVITTNGINYEVNTDDLIPTGEQTATHGDDDGETIGNNGSNVVITNIDLEQEVVYIKNLSNKDIDMTGWKIVSEKGNQVFDFPNGFILRAGATVQILSGRAEEGDGINKLKWTGSYIWNNDGDTGILYDNNDNEISRY